jgi:predicted MPP superfamily phosphohydrolase
MTSIRFLHFTDLHLGMKGLEDRWPAVQYALFEDLGKIHGEAGPWDLVVFTGDFVQSAAQPKQFDMVRGLLQALWEHLETLGSTPKLVVIPGNHDLARPDALDPAALVLQSSWDHEGLADEFFGKKESAYRRVVAQAFKHYGSWSSNPGVDVLEPTTQGLLPGDFSATYTKDDVRLGLLGLNTTFLQLSDKMREGSLAVDVRQFRRACANAVPEWIDAHDTCLLLTHHPQSWLREKSREDLMENVLQIMDNFALHLCGHLHEPKMKFDQVGGNVPTRLLQGASLYGREDDGRRIHGYSACELVFSDSLTMRCWPRLAHRRAQGGLSFQPDTDYVGDDGRTFTWVAKRGKDSRKPSGASDHMGSSNRESVLPIELKSALARRVTIYKRDLCYKFTVTEVTDHEVLVRLELSYVLVNATGDPQSYLAGFPSERPTKFIEASVGSHGENLVGDPQYIAGDILEFPVQLPPRDAVPVSVTADITYRVPDSEALTTFIPSLDYRLELVRSDALRVSVQSQMPERVESTRSSDNVDVYKATHPVLDYQGLRLDWTLRTDPS